MKKLFVMLLVCCCVMMAQGQKQTGKEKNLEVQFAPFSDKPVSMSGIRFRKFNATGTGAWRINLMMEFFSIERVTQQANLFLTPIVPELRYDSSTVTIAIAPGYEKHLPGTERLSPYLGGEIAFVMATSTEEQMFEDPNTAGETYTVTVKNRNGYTAFGLNLIAGCDYYFAKSIYLGVEFGYGFSALSASDIETSSTEANAANIADQKQGSGFAVGSNSTAQLRLGFLF
jgi:hypothetical protein